MKIKVSVGNSRMDKKWRLMEMELEEFRDRIFQTKVTAESVAEFKKMPKAQQDAIKDIGGFVLGTLKGGRRKKDCVVSRSALSLDMDYASQEVIEQVEMFFSFRCFFYAPKFVSPGLDGVPDRLVLLPGGRLAFVEVKAPGKKPRPIQRRCIDKLTALGFRVYVLDDTEQIGGILDEVQTA